MRAVRTPWPPAPRATRRAFCHALGAGGLAAGCSLIFDPGAYHQARTSSDGGVVGVDTRGPATLGGVLLIGGTLDGFNAGEATREVFLVRTNGAGIVTAFTPQLQVAEASRYAARSAGGIVTASCPGWLGRASLDADGITAWNGGALADPGNDMSLVFAGPWLLAIGGSQVRALAFAEPQARWVTLSERLKVSRRLPTVVYAAGQLHVLGGAGGDQNALSSGERASFDENNGTVGAFMAIDPAPESLFGCAAIRAGNQLYVLGGNRDGYIVNTGLPHDTVVAATVAPDGALGPWRAQPPLLTPLTDASVWTQGDRVYVAGGRRGSGNPPSALVGSASIGAAGDLGAWDFQSHGRLPTGRFNVCAVVV